MRTITVKGTGNVRAKADYVVLNFYLEAKDREYEETVRIASEQIDALKNALSEIGIEKDSLKTSDFSVHTFTKSVRDKAGNYKRCGLKSKCAMIELPKLYTPRQGVCFRTEMYQTDGDQDRRYLVREAMDRAVRGESVPDVLICPFA